MQNEKLAQVARRQLWVIAQDKLVAAALALSLLGSVAGVLQLA